RPCAGRYAIAGGCTTLQRDWAIDPQAPGICALLDRTIIADAELHDICAYRIGHIDGSLDRAGVGRRRKHLRIEAAAIRCDLPPSTICGLKLAGVRGLRNNALVVS